MFDIGFFELLVIAVVGLVVIGPERLPGAIRSGALWWGRIKRSIRETRSELERQLGADEIRRELHNEEVMRSLEALRRSQKELEREVKEAADSGDTSAALESPAAAGHSEPPTKAESTLDAETAKTGRPAASAKPDLQQPPSAQEPDSAGQHKDV